MTDSPGDSSADPGPQEPETPPARFPPDTNGTYWFEAPGRGDREDPPGEAHHHEDSPGGYPSSGHYGPPDSPSSSAGGPSSSAGGPSSSAGGPTSSAGGPTRSAGGYDISSESTSGPADSHYGWTGSASGPAGNPYTWNDTPASPSGGHSSQAGSPSGPSGPSGNPYSWNDAPASPAGGPSSQTGSRYGPAAGYTPAEHTPRFSDETAPFPAQRTAGYSAAGTWTIPAPGSPSGSAHGTPPGGPTGMPPGGPPAAPPGMPPGTPPGAGRPRPLPGLPPLSSGFPGAPTNKKKRLLVGGIAGAVLIVIAGAIGAYALLHTRGSPQQAAQDYLTGWQQNQPAAMGKVSLGVPAGGLAGPVHQAEADLGVRGKTLRLGAVRPGSNGTARATYTASLTLGNGIHWSYQGSLQLVRQKRHWWVSWSPAAIHPQLRPGERFQVSAQWLQRGAIFAADGTRLDSSQAEQESGSIQMITGSLGPLTAEQAKKLGAPYKQGDTAGQGGIQQAEERRLAGTPRTLLRLVDSHGNVQHTLASFGGKAGSSVKTSIDMSVQQAASHAVASAKVGNKPVAMVAIRPSTGDVLAVVNKPGGYDRALLGTYPPGSTFKMITASALVKSGMRPSDSVPCPATIKIGGHPFHNYNYEKLGTTDLLTAFAVSCNTTFAQLGSQRLSGSQLAAMASQFGFGTTPQLGIPAALGHFTTPTDSISLAMDAFGQGEDIVNPLQLATVAGALGNGAWRSPRLVMDPAPRHIPAPHQIDPSITAALRPMMGAVVSKGTAAHVGFPPGVYGKTGTAEYGQGKNPPSHAWFAGYRGDLAFAVIVEGGGVGADASGPIANAFLRGQ